MTPAIVESLRGRNVIAVNFMYTWAPWAPMMFFADPRFWHREMRERPNLLKAFEGLILTTSRGAGDDADPRLRRLKHFKPPPGLQQARDSVAIARSSLTASINIAKHTQAGRIILVGADNRDGPNGRAHCHTEYPWTRSKKTWTAKHEELYHVAKALHAVGLPCFNASPISALPFWAKVDLKDFL